METPTDERSLTIVANRLPVKRTEEGWTVSPGGLVTALRPVLAERGGSWVGWVGETGPAPNPFDVGNLHLAPVELSADEVENYYEGFANGTLWPLYHNYVRPPEYHRHWWHPYKQVNERFAECVAEVAPNGGAVWVHDYHLSLVPRMLRERRPDLRIGFFLHIPFPPMELFAQLPWRDDILRGMLGADSVGFQTVYGARNFRRVARRYLHAYTRGVLVRLDERIARAEPFPISIDTRQFAEDCQTPEVEHSMEELRGLLGDRRIVLGVDRLDYTKGIEVRLRAYQTVLEQQPDLPEDVVFVQIAVPSRTNVAGYPEMRHAIEHLTGHINGQYGRLGRVAVHYRYTSVPREELLALYRAADVMAVTPPRDGMNLVSKEYVACRIEEDGVLVLSEFAGAAHELSGAVSVNPFDLDGTARALTKALAMPREEQQRRMRPMRQHLFQHDVHRWAQQALAAFGAHS